MQILIKYLCLALVLATASALTCKDARERLSRARYRDYDRTGEQLECVDPCDARGYVYQNRSECIYQRYCYWNGTMCFLKKVRSIGNLQPSYAVASAIMENSGRTSARNFNLFGGNPNFPFPICRSFPDNCDIDPFSPELHLLLEPPVNIPYCQRIACSAYNPALEDDNFACLAIPGCYFDSELAYIRDVYGHSILPGVPVCHLAVRNSKFQDIAKKYTEKNGNTWNALLTKCLIEQNRDVILTSSPGCYMLDVLEYMGIKPKRAGWTGITANDCYLIGGCFKSPNFCYRPVKLNHVQVRSENDEYRSTLPTGTSYYGQPECIVFNASADATDYLHSYHQCMQSGCVPDLSVTDSIKQKLYEVTMSKVPERLRPFFWQLVNQNVVGADNWEEEVEKLVKNQKDYASNYFYGLGNSNFPRFSIQNIAIILSQNNPNSANRNLAPFEQVQNNGGIPPFPLPSSGELSNAVPIRPWLNKPEHTSSGATYFPGGVPPFQNPVYSWQVPTCPFRQHNLPGFPLLRGSFTDCCRHNPCYQPRFAAAEQYSGVANYYAGWEDWGECSTTCGGGTKTRKRRCVAHKKSNRCDGTDTQSRPCNTGKCPTWLDWDDWSECSASCGGGVEKRTRLCDGVGCEGDKEQARSCNSEPCPVLGAWRILAPCSSTCGTGVQLKARDCNDTNTKLSCPEANSTALRKVEQCTSYCGDVVMTSESACSAYPGCAITRKYRCIYKDDDGRESEGHCEKFKAEEKSRCLGEHFSCRFCNLFLPCETL
ncbi:uncharacterized protein LOC143467999 [Clavelina lepadiformis]|uniref:uncharacterized protein LOC143467999 n=1 Tax=Clavelina lepadiformis TaxID=159417 RepID=UPI004041EB23